MTLRVRGSADRFKMPVYGKLFKDDDWSALVASFGGGPSAVAVDRL